jgi:alpha-tubulin suppressor-like RCC1 family protein
MMILAIRPALWDIVVLWWLDVVTYRWRHRFFIITTTNIQTQKQQNDGECYTWGEGKFGRLGHGTELNAVVPTLVQAFRQLSSSARPVQISCGGFHTAVVTDAGSLYTFGGGEHGYVGCMMDSSFCGYNCCSWGEFVS